MDKETLRNFLVSAAVFFLVLWTLSTLLPSPSRPQLTPAGGAAQRGDERKGSAPSAAGEPEKPDEVEAGTAQSPSGETAATGFAVVEAASEQTRSMGAEPLNGMDAKAPASPYRMRLVLSNVGASVTSATMTDHAQTLGSDERYTLLAPIERPDGTRFRSLTIEKINIDGADVVLGDKKWHAGEVERYQKSGEQGQRLAFSITITESNKPALKLTRVYELPEQPKDLGRHDLRSTLAVENLTSKARRVLVSYLGGIGIRQTAGARSPVRYVDCGLFDGTRVNGERKSERAISLKPAEPVRLYPGLDQPPQARLAWAATDNTYFTATIAPLNRDGTDDASYLAEVTAVDLDGLSRTDDDVTVRFVTQAEPLHPDSVLRYPADIYLGEKDGEAFREIESYRRRNYYYQISQGFGWCTFSFLVELMIWLLNGLHFVTRDYGVAIIVLVLIVRSLLHPITKKGQVNMVRMQKKMGEFAPKVEELKKRYANDKVRLQQETMKLYREHGINPATQMLNCLPMALQMPIWFALFLSLSNNIELRHQPFLFTWIRDLTAPDALVTFSTPLVIPVVGWTLPSFNLLPLLVAFLMYLQQKLQPKTKPNPDASDQQRQQQEMMQKMMPMMSVMMLIFFYKMPSGLNLYIMFSSGFGAIEQYWIRKHIREREAAGTLDKAVAKAGQGLRRKRSGEMSWFERLQKMAEEAKKSQPRRPEKDKSRR